MKPIDTIVFDVGRVLVDFNLVEFSEFLQTRGLSIQDTPDLIEQTKMHQYECGKLSSEEFLNGLNKLLPQPIEIEELAKRWRNIFAPINPMLGLLEAVALDFRTFLLSNTNELHWEFLESEYRLNQKVDGVMTSFEAGALKPNERIYLALEEKCSLNPNSVLFIDDVEQHIAAARQRGWQGVHHTSFNNTVAQLQKLGIEFNLN